MTHHAVKNVGLFSTPKTSRTEVVISLGQCHIPIPLVSTPDKSAQFAYLKLNDIPEFVEEGARLVAGYIKSSGYKRPYFVTAEASTLALAHVLRARYGIDGVTLYKSAQLNDVDPVSAPYSAITALGEQKLFLGKNRMKKLLEADEVIILDSICTKGSTIRAMYNVVMKAGVSPDKIKEAVVLFTEGEPRQTLDVGRDTPLKLKSFGTMPLIKTELMTPSLK